MASLEVRVPVLGPEGFGLIPFNFLPLEIAPFIDAGAAWTKEQSVRFAFDRETLDRGSGLQLWDERAGEPVRLRRTRGVLRVPDPPEEGWHWGFNFAPGW